MKFNVAQFDLFCCFVFFDMKDARPLSEETSKHSVFRTIYSERKLTGLYEQCGI